MKIKNFFKLKSRLISKFFILISFFSISIAFYIALISERNSVRFKISTHIDEVPSINDELMSRVSHEVTSSNESYKFDEIIKEFCPVKENKAGYSCLNRLSSYEINHQNEYESEFEKTYYHTFWKIKESKRHHFRVLILQIISFLVTQDHNRAIFIIWIQRKFPININRQINDRFAYYLKNNIIKIKILNFIDLCSNGKFKSCYRKCASVRNQNSVAFSDFVRFLVLYKYGGIYVDGDVIFLRDMRPFWNKNFVHRWSFTEDYNTAVMGLRLNRSKSIEAIYEKIIQTPRLTNLVAAFYPTKIKNTIRDLNNGDIFFYKDFSVYHSILFDPSWLCNDGMLPRFNNVTVCQFNEFYDTTITKDDFKMDQFFNGAFSFHLHLKNCGKCEIGNSSYFHHIENYFVEKLENYYPK